MKNQALIKKNGFIIIIMQLFSAKPKTGQTSQALHSH